MNTNYNVAVV